MTVESSEKGNMMENKNDCHDSGSAAPQKSAAQLKKEAKKKEKLEKFKQKQEKMQDKGQNKAEVR